MKSLIDIVKLVPRSVQLTLAGILIGITAVYAHESRYMTVGDFTKSYVLDLKAEIRAIRRELQDDTLSERYRAALREQLDRLIDDLCLEAPDDPYCDG